VLAAGWVVWMGDVQGRRDTTADTCAHCADCHADVCLPWHVD